MCHDRARPVTDPSPNKDTRPSKHERMFVEADPERKTHVTRRMGHTWRGANDRCYRSTACYGRANWDKAPPPGERATSLRAAAAVPGPEPAAGGCRRHPLGQWLSLIH